MRAWYIDMWVKDLAGDVADGVHAACDPQLRVRLHELAVGVQPDGREAETGKIDLPAGRDQQPLRGQLVAADVDGEAGPVVVDPLRRDTGVDANTFAGEHLGEQAAGLRLVRRQQTVGHLDDVDPAAEPGEGLGELGTDRTAAEHDQGLRCGLGRDRFPVRPERAVGKAWNRRDRRIGARVEDDRPGRREFLVPDTDGVRAGDLRPAADEPAAGLLEPVDGDLVVPAGGGLGADALRDRAEVGLRRGGPGQFVDAAGLGEAVGGPDHHLGRDTRVVRAFAAHQVGLDPDHRQPGGCQVGADRLSSGSHPDHYDIDLLGHLLAPCSGRCCVVAAAVARPVVIQQGVPVGHTFVLSSPSPLNSTH